MDFFAAFRLPKIAQDVTQARLALTALTEQLGRQAESQDRMRMDLEQVRSLHARLIHQSRLVEEHLLQLRQLVSGSF